MKRINNPKVFVVEDDLITNEIYSEQLRSNGFADIHSIYSGKECLSKMHLMPDIMILDHQLGDTTGLEILKNVKSIDPDIHVVFLTGQESLETAVDTLKYGAFDYINKKENTPTRLLETINQIMNVERIIKREKSNNLFKKAIILSSGAGLMLYLIGMLF